MPELSVQYGANQKFQAKRHMFYDAAQDSFSKPPAQNPDLFQQLTNILPTSVEGILKRRWGYQLWSGSGSNTFRELYEFQRDTDLARRIIGTAADGTGTPSGTNLVSAYNENGTSWNPSLFNPSAGAGRVHMLNSRNYAFFEDGVAADLVKWDGSPSAGPATLTLSAAANSSGGNTVYTGTGLSVLLTGEDVRISGFVTNTVNNGFFTVVSSTPTTVTVNNPSGVAESHAASLASDQGFSNWGIVAPAIAPTVGAPSGGGSQTYTLSQVANAAGGNTVYTGVGLSSLFTNTSVEVQGFTTSANNGPFTVVSTTATTVTLNNPVGVAETDPGSLVTQNQIRPTTFLNGWGPNQHVGGYEGGINQGFTFGLDGSTTSAYLNPGNAFDGNLTTFASGFDQHNHSYGGVVWKFTTQTTNSVNIQLAVLSEVPVSGTDGKIVTARSAGIWYTINAGSTWTAIYNSPSRPKQYDIVTLPDGQDMGQVQVMAFYDSHDDMYHKVYDIFIEATTTGSGPLTLTSGRQYFLAFENSIAQNFSDVSPVSTSTGPLFGAAIPLSDLAVSSDPQVDMKVILATADGGDQTILYLVAQIANATTTFVDNVAELQLLASNVYAFTDTSGNNFGLFNNLPPPNAHFPTKHRGRVFLTNGESLFFSKSLGEVITPTGVVAGRYEEDYPPENELDISAGAETARGLLSDGDFLYIGTDRRILRLVGDGPDNFQPPQSAFTNGGLLCQETWQKIFLDGNPLGCMWLTPDFRVIASDFNNSKDVGTPIQDLLSSINPTPSISAKANAVYYADGSYNLYALAIPTGSNTECDTLCVYDLKTQRWYTWILTDTVTAMLFQITAAGIPQKLFWTASDKNGYNFIDTLGQDRVNNTPVNFTRTAKTSWLDFQDSTLRKVINWMQIITGDPTIQITVEGASLDQDFLSPRTVIAATAPKLSPFGDYTLYLAGHKTRDRFYRFTFTSSANVQDFLSGIDIRGFGFHNF